MVYVTTQTTNHVATVTLSRGKVNAINAAMVQEFHHQLDNLERDSDVRTVVLTGSGKFFSFGFDIPELISYSRTEFREFLTAFTSLTLRLFLFPKPVVAALNGHTVAGGCILATACDYRIMAENSGKVGLNEINLGVSFFASATEMLRYVVGSRIVDGILSSGEIYLPEQAMDMGLIDEVVPAVQYLDRLHEIARSYAAKEPAAFAGMRQLLRRPIADQIAANETVSIDRFTDHWYSDYAQAILQQVQIRS